MGCRASSETAPESKAPSLRTQVNNANLQDIENFTSDALSKGPKVDSVKMILSDRIGRDAFTEFLKLEYAEENLSFFQDVETLKSSESNDFAKSAESIIDSYIKPGSQSEINIPEKLRENIASSTQMDKDTFLKSLESAQNEIIVILAMGAFPRFLKSEQYSKYRQAKNKTTNLLNKHVSSDQPSQSPYTSLRTSEAVVTLERTLRTVDIDEVDKLLNSGSWFTTLLGAVESLPICVSIATARQDRRGFPLVYVNQKFESTTGYPRSEIVGRNCRFLQGAESEKDSIDLLVAALRDAKPVKVSITNYRKDGTIFRNLLSMKPIFDTNGVYRYVIGVQFDISSRGASASSLKMADDLIRMLPDTIFDEGGL